MTKTSYHHPGSPGTFPCPLPGLPCHEETLSPRDAGDLAHLIRQISARIEKDWSGSGFQAPQLRVRSVLEEAVCNAWFHGNRQTPSTPIVVRWHNRHDFVLEVIDQGHGFDVTRIPDPTASENITKPTGRGIHIIRYFAKDIRWSTPGNHVLITLDRDFAFDF